MAPASRGRSSLCPQSFHFFFAPTLALSLIFAIHTRGQILELQTQLPTVSLISNIAGYGWQPGFPCNKIAPEYLKCDSDGYVTALILPPTSGAYLPDEIGTLTRLTRLETANNGYSDVIPSSIGKLRKLKILTLAANIFSGSLPASMGSLSSLVYLNVSSNFLTGPVPPALQKLSTLVQVDLSNNYLSGSAAFSVGCNRVDLSSNCLSRASICTSQGEQRSAAECSSACLASVWQTPAQTPQVCSGQGVCLPLGAETAGVASDWSCLCSSSNNDRRGKARTFQCGSTSKSKAKSRGN